MKKLQRYICVMAHPHRVLYIHLQPLIQPRRLNWDTVAYPPFSYIITIILVAVFIVVA